MSHLLITGGVPKHLYCCVTRQSSTRQGVFQSVFHEHIFVVVKEASPLVCFRVFQMLRLQNTAMGSDTGEAMAELWNEGKVGKLILINMMNMLIVMTMMMSKVIVMVMKMKIIRGSGRVGQIPFLMAYHQILIENNPQLMDCHLVCKDGDTQANRAILAVHRFVLNILVFSCSFLHKIKVFFR